MADSQINRRSRAFIDEYGLRESILFASDADSQLIKQLAILKQDPEPIEAGVPHPTTFLLDREGVVRFRDVRTDYHIWLAPERILAELAKIP